MSEKPFTQKKALNKASNITKEFKIGRTTVEFVNKDNSTIDAFVLLNPEDLDNTIMDEMKAKPYFDGIYQDAPESQHYAFFKIPFE